MQLSLIKDNPSILYYPDFLDPQRAKDFFQHFYTRTKWEQDAYNFGGKEVLVPRLTSWHGAVPYKYSGLVKQAQPLDGIMTYIISRLTFLGHGAFNSVLLNFYRDGNDSVSWHADNEPELGHNPVIASISLGYPRTFELRHRVEKGKSEKILLESGSLLIMRGDTQTNYLHRVPKEPDIKQPRINLTFRYMYDHLRSTK